VSSALLILLAPILILIAILVRLDSPGPALFVQKRVGQGGERFDMFKFRSMHDGAPKYAPSPTSSSDPRITRIGRYLRRASLDELPQLVNVLMGTMSLVGPRPEMPFIVEGYDARQRQRLQVTPGITGLWQLSADRAYPIHENAAYDLYYIRNRSVSLDLSILIHTLFFAVRGGI
jgi:lipopolysaccharide/colanic/teichoic acid biosynthesis glycosyltransferase